MRRPSFPQLPVRGLGPVTLVVTSALLATACTIPPVTDPASRYYDVPTGSVVSLRQDIEIPPGWARAHLQGGRIVAWAALQRYEPYCELEVNDVTATPRQFVRAGAFTVVRVRREQELGAVDSGIKLAAAGSASGLGFGRTRLTQFDSGDDGGSQLVLNEVRLQLNSPEQPQVRELRCNTGWALRPHALYPTVAEMRGTLGELASIEIR